MSNRFLAAMCCGLVVVVGLSPDAAAQAPNPQRRPVPAAAVVTTDGTTVPLSQLGSAGQWLIVYITPSSPASARLLGALEQWQLNPHGRLVILVADAPATAAAFVAKAAPRLPGARWATVDDVAVWNQLQLRGVPSLIGAVGGTMDWRLSGVLNDPVALESVFRSWLQP